MDSLEKLDADYLPPPEAFYNDFSSKGISAEDYEYCMRVWEGEGITSFKDFLIWYNNLDVAPFIEALGKQSAIYKQKGIDMLKSAISLPGLAIRWMFKEVETVADGSVPSSRSELRDSIRKQQPVCLLDETNRDLEETMRSNIVGGPSIIYHRYHDWGKTAIRARKYGKEARPCRRVVGLDANALYLYCLGGTMPTGYPRRRLLEDGFALQKNKKFSKVAHGWLMWNEKKGGQTIKHQQKGGEIKIGRHGLPVDGFCSYTNTVFQFHGCFWHGHGCEKNKGKKDE